MNTQFSVAWIVNIALGLSLAGCGAQATDEQEPEGTSDDALGGGAIRVTNPNNQAYSNIDSVLDNWDSWVCMVSAGNKTREVSVRFAQEQAKVPKGAKFYWLVYGKYVSADNHCVDSYSLSFNRSKMDPPIIPLDDRGRPQATYQLGTLLGTKNWR
jgi:hypothetical protein